jgi:hypothetical protein
VAALAGVGADRAARLDAAARGNFDAAIAAIKAELADANVGGVINLTNAALADNALRAAVATEAASPAAGPIPTAGDRAGIITYLKAAANGDEKEGDTRIAAVRVNPLKKQTLEAIGKRRFDTRFIRNLLAIINIGRLVRLKLNREMTSRNVLVSSHMAIAAGVTEYGSDPFAPNETTDSRQLDGLPRFSTDDSF